MHSKVLWSFTVSSVVALILTGCAPAPQRPDDGDLTQDEYGSTDSTTVVKLQTGNPAVRDLWAQAEQARQVRNFDDAASKLERILRITPEDAVIWSRLAEVRLEQSNANQAENLAAKSNAMVVDDMLLNCSNWLIISRARKLKGDDIGAQEAEYTASSFCP
jgi:predicted Zn-dependent protease